METVARRAPTAPVIAFPGCFRGELAVIRHELEELRRGAC
jgi:hypothetical protein